MPMSDIWQRFENIYTLFLVLRNFWKYSHSLQNLINETEALLPPSQVYNLKNKQVQGTALQPPATHKWQLVYLKSQLKVLNSVQSVDVTC